MVRMEHVAAGYATEGQGAGPLWVTQKAGIFAKRGLEVEIRLLGSAVRVVEELVGGSIAFGNLAAPALVKAVLGGADLVYLTGGINQQFLVGRPDLADLGALADGIIGVSEPDDLTDFLARVLLNRRPELGEVRLQRCEGSRDRLERLLKGEIDATILSPPVAFEARRHGCPLLLDFADYGLNFALGGLAASRTLILERPELVKTFLAAYVEGMRYYKTHPAFAIRVQQEYSGVSEIQIAQETYDASRAGFPDRPLPVVSALQQVVDFLSRDQAPSHRVTGEDLAESRFLQEIADE